MAYRARSPSLPRRGGVKGTRPGVGMEAASEAAVESGDIAA